MFFLPSSYGKDSIRLESLEYRGYYIAVLPTILSKPLALARNDGNSSKANYQSIFRVYDTTTACSGHRVANVSSESQDAASIPSHSPGPTPGTPSTDSGVNLILRAAVMATASQDTTALGIDRSVEGSPFDLPPSHPDRALEHGNDSGLLVDRILEAANEARESLGTTLGIHRRAELGTVSSQTHLGSEGRLLVSPQRNTTNDTAASSSARRAHTQHSGGERTTPSETGHPKPSASRVNTASLDTRIVLRSKRQHIGQSNRGGSISRGVGSDRSRRSLLMPESTSQEEVGVIGESSLSADDTHVGEGYMAPPNLPADSVTGRIVHMGVDRGEDGEGANDVLDFEGSIVLRKCNTTSVIRIQLRAPLSIRQRTSSGILDGYRPTSQDASSDAPTITNGRTIWEPTETPTTLEPRLRSFLDTWRQEEDAGSGNSVN